jgi:hypothetical protein
MNHEKTFEAISKLKEVEIELHRLKNALEMTNRALETKDEQWGSSSLTNPEFVAEQKEKTQQLRNMVDMQNMASKSTYKEQVETKDEPVAIVDSTISGHIDWLCPIFPKQGTRLYTTPQRTWVGLTDEEIDKIRNTPMSVEGGVGFSIYSYARTIEAKLKERNT